jgi:hypothetical protein
VRSRWPSAFTVLALAALGLTANVAFSQTTGGIEGTVTDANDAPLPGASVELRSPSLQGRRSRVTSAAGHFRFPAIPPGSYTVTCSLPGIKRVERDGVIVTLDETANVLIRMEISVKQDIVVTDEAPVVDTNDAASSFSIRQNIVVKLPLGRNYAQAVEINPGVGLDSADTQGRAMAFSIYGATSIENQYLVDGVNTTNVIRGFQGKAISSEFVEEVQIKAGGYEAEYGRAMGGIINVVTKSGGNDFHGDGFGYFNAKSLTAARKGTAATDENYTGPPVGVDTSQANVQDLGVDLGGYGVKDRLWFFGAYNRVNQDVDQLTLPGTGLPNAGMNFPITYHADLFSGKLTGRPTDSTTIVGTIFGDPEVRTGALRNFTSSNPLSQDGTRKIGATDFAIGLTQLFGSTGFFDARFSEHRDRYTVAGVGASTVSVWDYTQNLDEPTFSGGFGAIVGATDNNHSKRDAIKASQTFFLGVHEVKGGVDYENNLTVATTSYSGGSILFIYACDPQVCTGAHANDATYYGHAFYTLSTDKNNLQNSWLPGGHTVQPRAYRTGAFLQDSWKVLPNLSVHIGLRWDQEDIRQYDGSKIYNAQVVDSNGNIIQRGGQMFTLKNEWQPRLGIAWDPMKDGSTKVSASYGRFYYALPTDLTVRSYGDMIAAATFNYNSNTASAAALAQDPTIGIPASAGGGYNPAQFQDNLKGIYQDEYALGFEKALGPALSVATRFTYRNLGRTIEDRCDLDAGYPEANGNTCVIINPGSSSPFATGQGVHTCDGRDYIDASGNSPQSQCTGPQTTNQTLPAAERKFYGVEFIVKNRISNQVWGQFSYLWSHLYGNYNGEASIGEFAYPGGGGTDPGINVDFDYPQFEKNAYGNLALDRRHQFRLDGAYTMPVGLTIGLDAHLRSGTPLSEYGYFNSGYGAEGYQVVPTGSAGRLPWNYDFNLSLSYTMKFSGMTATLIAQGNNLLNKQDVLGRNQDCTVAPPPTPGAVTNCSAVTNPTSANPDYGLVTWRSNSRVFKVAARLTF